MGYFANGSEGEAYEAMYCRRCVHENDDSGCAVWDAHLMHNYDECNKPESILHLLIPRGEHGGNLQCKMFVERGRSGGGETVPIRKVA